jgi:hypothetical protein
VLLLLLLGLCAGHDELGVVSLVLTNTLQEVYAAAYGEKFKGKEHQQEVRLQLLTYYAEFNAALAYYAGFLSCNLLLQYPMHPLKPVQLRLLPCVGACRLLHCAMYSLWFTRPVLLLLLPLLNSTPGCQQV